MEQAVEEILNESPELRAANVDVTRSELMLRRTKVEKIPDLLVSKGVRCNRELLEQGAAGMLMPFEKGFAPGSFAPRTPLNLARMKLMGVRIGTIKEAAASKR